MKSYQIISLFFLLIIFLPAKTIAQEIILSDTAEVSILTMGPGDVLNDSFGHSAFRVKILSKTSMWFIIMEFMILTLLTFI